MLAFAAVTPWLGRPLWNRTCFSSNKLLVAGRRTSRERCASQLASWRRYSLPCRYPWRCCYSGLFPRDSFGTSVGVDAGFRGNGVLFAGADGAREGYRGAGAGLFYEGLLQEIQWLPGIASASYSIITPLAGGGISQDVFIDGRPVSREQIYFERNIGGLLRNAGSPVVLGREFTARDTAAAEPVALVNQAFARRYLPQGTPLGRHLTVAASSARVFCGCRGQKRLFRVPLVCSAAYRLHARCATEIPRNGGLRSDIRSTRSRPA